MEIVFIFALRYQIKKKKEPGKTSQQHILKEHLAEIRMGKILKV